VAVLKRAYNLIVKRCPGCEETKSAANFYASKTSKDGLQSRCKDCNRTTAREFARAHKAEKKEYAAQWYQRNREKSLTRNRQWHAENVEYVAQQKKRWRETNPDYQILWCQSNRDRQREYRDRRRSRQNSVPICSFTALELKQRWEYYGNCCWVCREIATETDHVKPLAKGGAHMLCNLRPICKSCNSRKRDRWPLPGPII
jgi:5-methylcytosine-specific restriction endonuclease McrA